MSTRSRASQWFGPRAASGPLQYKAPPQTLLVIGWLPAEPQVLCFSKPFELEDTQMSNFKVGDVVRYKPGHEDKSGKLPAGPHHVLAIHPGSPLDGWMPRLELKADPGLTWRAERFNLISRPSDPLAAPRTALKVGDRVRVQNVAGLPISIIGTVGILGLYDSKSSRWLVNLPDGLKYSGWWCTDAELELLPPEPANRSVGADEYLSAVEHMQQRPEQYKREIMGTWAPPKPSAAKPMTATAANIRVHPIGVNFKRFADKYLRPNPNPLSEDGWMPAGTYMPLKEEGEGDDCGKGSTAPDGTFTFVRYKRMDVPLTAEGGHGIAKPIPHYERRFPSRVATWSNLGDDYDLLPDAE